MEQGEQGCQIPSLESLPRVVMSFTPAPPQSRRQTEGQLPDNTKTLGTLPAAGFLRCLVVEEQDQMQSNRYYRNLSQTLVQWCRCGTCTGLSATSGTG